jgi:hypothetical protein
MGDRFRAVWVVDFEFTHHPSGKPNVICLAAREMNLGQQLALWHDEIGPAPPYDIGPDAVVVFYSGQEAELACHLALNWPLPANCVDLMVEYRMATNAPGSKSWPAMLSACVDLGVPIKTSPAEKTLARDRILRGEAARDWTLDYCRADVEEEADLLQALQRRGHAPLSPWAIWRGHFMKAIARMWWRGVPVNPRYIALATDPEARLALKQALIDDLRPRFPIYDGVTMKLSLLSEFLESVGIPVPRTRTGRPSTSEDALGRLVPDYPILEPLVDSLHSQKQLRDFSLPIGADYRLRAWFAPFSTITSRAAPPTNAYIYNLPAWMRAMMRPEPGRALAYLDWSAMEFGIAAAMSRDPNMVDFYQSGDPYLACATAAGAAPVGATKQSHHVERDLYKTGVLACLYGIAAESLAQRLKRSTLFAHNFLRWHRATFASYWRWSDEIVAGAIHSGGLRSRHGWTYTVRPPFNIRSLRNWAIQTAGADILRCACILADAQGIETLATAHDAVLVEGAETDIETVVATMADCMQRAAAILLDGFVLRCSVEIKRSGERFIEERGRRTLAIVDHFLEAQSEYRA